MQELKWDPPLDQFLMETDEFNPLPDLPPLTTNDVAELLAISKAHAANLIERNEWEQ